MKKSAKKIARQRMVLGGLLLVCVLLFSWTRLYTAPDTLPVFGYELREDPTPASQTNGRFIDEGLAPSRDYLFLRMQDTGGLHTQK